MTNPAPFTLIIPAHNEEAVIARCLHSVLADAPPEYPMQIIVAANGCTDKTVERARTAAPTAVILELAESSKTAAINAANAVAQHYPRIYLDADVECDFSTLAALADCLADEQVMIAAPGIRIDLSRANHFVKAYYRVWLNQPYARDGKGGAGCYALSQAALDHIGGFPDLVADDLWVHTRFPDAQRRIITKDRYGKAVFTIVHPPRTAREQFRVEARRQIGNRALRRTHASPHLVRSGGKGGIMAAFRGGAAFTDIAIFVAIKLAARLESRWRIMRGRGDVWSRDMSSRQP